MPRPVLLNRGFCGHLSRVILKLNFLNLFLHQRYIFIGNMLIMAFMSNFW
jgi:hypothetical protein